jgi:hypothetical protein
MSFCRKDAKKIRSLRHSASKFIKHQEKILIFGAKRR